MAGIKWMSRKVRWWQWFELTLEHQSTASFLLKLLMFKVKLSDGLSLTSGDVFWRESLEERERVRRTSTSCATRRPLRVRACVCTRVCVCGCVCVPPCLPLPLTACFCNFAVCVVVERACRRCHKFFRDRFSIVSVQTNTRKDAFLLLLLLWFFFFARRVQITHEMKVWKSSKPKTPYHDEEFKNFVCRFVKNKFYILLLSIFEVYSAFFTLMHLEIIDITSFFVVETCSVSCLCPCLKHILYVRRYFLIFCYILLVSLF